MKVVDVTLEYKALDDSSDEEYFVVPVPNEGPPVNHMGGFFGLNCLGGETHLVSQCLIGRVIIGAVREVEEEDYQ